MIAAERRAEDESGGAKYHPETKNNVPEHTEAMPQLEWSSELEIGIYEIDLQHRALVSIANQLHDAVEGDKPVRTVEWILDELLLYAKMHFQTEEQYMRRYEHQATGQHKKEHGELLKSMRRFRRKLEAEEDVGDELLEFLAGWLSNHLNGPDRALGEAYQARLRGAVK